MVYSVDISLDHFIMMNNSFLGRGLAREAPYRWRHAGLEELRQFLVNEQRAGRYHPILSEGLE